MAADTIAVAIKKRMFEGASRLNSWRRTVGSLKADGLEQILRNNVDELDERIQSGSGTLDGAGELDVTFGAAMPDTGYEVSVTFKGDPGAVVVSLFIKAGRTAAAFTIGTNAVLAAKDVEWIARSRTRINTKA